MRAWLLFAALLLPITAANAGEKYEGAMEAFAKQDKQTPPPAAPIVFTGSSTIRIWDLARDFPGVQALNRGFGGSQYADLIEYFPRVLTQYKPQQVVLYSGDNDIAHGKSAEAAFEDFKKVAERLEKELPGVPVIVLGVKPSIARWNLWPVIQQFNGLVKDYAAAHAAYMTFLDLAPILLNPENKPNPDYLLEDGLHLNPTGYAAIAKHLAPLLKNQ